MTRFLKRILVFSVPILIYCGFIVVVDPFAYFNWFSVISPKTKIVTAKALNECLWKMNEYDRHPASGILLGDSRMDAMPADKVTDVTNRKYFNFGFGGASVNEMIDAFWFAANRTRLTDVYIGLNLNVYNDYNYTERTATYKSIRHNPLLYFVNRTVLQAAVYQVYSQVSHTDLQIGVPQMSREDFWRNELDVLTPRYYTNFVYPVKYRTDLQRVSEYCKKSGIHLAFIIFPTHVDLQNRIRDFHLEDANYQFRRDLAAMAPTYDFDYVNRITLQKENFSDPYHYRPPIADLMIGEVWQGRAGFGRRSETP